MRKSEYDKRIQKLVTTSLMICLILLLTSTFKIPVPMTQGYVHLGDAMIFLSVMLLGKKTARSPPELDRHWAMCWAVTRFGRPGLLSSNF